MANILNCSISQSRNKLIGLQVLERTDCAIPLDGFCMLASRFDQVHWRRNHGPFFLLYGSHTHKQHRKMQDQNYMWLTRLLPGRVLVEENLVSLKTPYVILAST